MITSITWVAWNPWGLVLVGMGTTSFHCGPASERLACAGAGFEAVTPGLASIEVYPSRRTLPKSSGESTGSLQA